MAANESDVDEPSFAAEVFPAGIVTDVSFTFSRRVSDHKAGPSGGHVRSCLCVDGKMISLVCSCSCRLNVVWSTRTNLNYYAGYAQCVNFNHKNLIG